MAIKLLTVNDVYNIREAKYLVDTEAEKDGIPEQDKVQGTQVLVIEGSKRYRMNSAGEWVEMIQSGGGSSGGSDLPDVTTDDNGKVLGVVNGEWDKVDAPSSLPDVTAADEDKILQVNGYGEWVANSLPTHTYTLTYADGSTITINNVELDTSK